MVGRVCDSEGKTEPKSGRTFPVIGEKKLICILLSKSL